MGRGASGRSKPAKPKPKRRKKRGGLSDKKGTKGRGTSGKNYEQEQPPAATGAAPAALFLDEEVLAL